MPIIKNKDKLIKYKNDLIIKIDLLNDELAATKKAIETNNRKIIDDKYTNRKRDIWKRLV